MRLRKAWLLIIVGILLIGGLAAIAGMMQTPATTAKDDNDFGNAR